MIETLMEILKKYSLWIIVIITLNIIFGFLLWLVDGNEFRYLFPTMVLGSLLLYFIIALIVYKKDLKKQEVILSFLEEPIISKEKEIIGLVSKKEMQVIEKIGKIMRENQATIKNQSKNIDEYKEYIEAWAHEIKTPLGLMTFVLDNRREEISPVIYKRLEYARTKMQEDIERMLYYARLKASRNDYYFKEVSLKTLCCEVLEEYEILLQEQGIKVIVELEDFNVVSDKKGVQFIIRQVISNAIKYKKPNESCPHIVIASQENKKSIRLIIRDNGIGVKAYDLPLIFEKGFTGELGEQRKNSTGMGLYLAEQVAENLKITLEISEEYTDGFEISLVFPRVVR
ncbi:sensor histidine kinase [Clostridium tunisiense]|uniref:sensor histidine kinase n=1 Tax=Clostridium tunisiense TaxID=219748 RepID=UPI00030EAAC1|nr:sensor histidine kinase [Clostridium tunisiense]